MSSALPNPSSDSTPEQWAWPPIPARLKVYDKYQDAELELDTSAREWVFAACGRPFRCQFVLGPQGHLQRLLAVHTQADNSPSALLKFVLTVTRHWGLLRTLLAEGPSKLGRLWDQHVHDIDVAKAAKSTLRLACASGAGPWRQVHAPMVKSLDTRANKYLQNLKRMVMARERNLSVDSQASIVKLLDRDP